MTQEIYVVSFYDADDFPLYRRAVEMDADYAAGGLQQAMMEADGWLVFSEELSAEATRCDIRRATPEDLAELDLEEAEAP